MKPALKKRACKILIFCVIAILFSGCDNDLFNNDDNIIKGLKAALNIGTENASKVLGVQDGYLKDEAVKILLPEGAQPAFEITSKVVGTINEIKSVPGMNAVLEGAGIDFDALGGDLAGKFVTAFNRSAEKAAPEAVGVFATAIGDMTISDGKNILLTDDTIAATKYLHEKTYGGLVTAFNPVVNESMKAVTAMKIGNKDYNTLDAWSFITSQNNDLVKLIKSEKFQNALKIASTEIPILGAPVSKEQANTINSIQTVNPDLGSYVVERALDGIFTKVRTEETKIRNNEAGARVNDLLQDVFGQLDEWKKNK